MPDPIRVTRTCDGPPPLGRARLVEDRRRFAQPFRLVPRIRVSCTGGSTSVTERSVFATRGTGMGCTDTEDRDVSGVSGRAAGGGEARR
ncbi:hypothetical protein GCM10010297_18920 [Streptomyces malachitofuscus]|nr:hypothetical protein GCM10010297_18920 [Streptomyces malachitofuscus]